MNIVNISMILSFMKINTIILLLGMMSNSSNTYIKEIDNISFKRPLERSINYDDKLY